MTQYYRNNDKALPSDTAAMGRIVREGALIAGGARAILLQVANPDVGRGVADHSDFADRALDRLRTTLTYVYCITFGSPDEKRVISKQVTAVHRQVKGPAYTALNPRLQLWVAATLYDSAVLLYERCLGPLDANTAAAAYQQYRVLGTALQMREGMWPADRLAFREYWNHMLDDVEVTDAARGVCHDLLYPKHIPLLLRAGMPLIRLLTAGLLPERIRILYGIEWNPQRQRRFERFSATVRAVYPHIPVSIRQFPKTYCLWDMRRRLAHGVQPITADKHR